METKFFISKLIVVSIVLNLSFGSAYAMPGMHGSEGKNYTEAPRVSKSMGDKINTTGAELEITYSADGKPQFLYSTREGSIESPGSPYNFDIWISKNVDGKWQTPIYLGPNINTSAWELEPSFSDDGNVIYCTRYEPGNLLSGDLYVVQKVDGVAIS